MSIFVWMYEQYICSDGLNVYICRYRRVHVFVWIDVEVFNQKFGSKMFNMTELYVKNEGEFFFIEVTSLINIMNPLSVIHLTELVPPAVIINKLALS